MSALASTGTTKWSQVKALLLFVSFLSALTQLTLDQHVLTASQPDPHWAGYEFWAVGYNVWQAHAQFTVPSISQPPNGCIYAGSWPAQYGDCAVAIWVGLSEGDGGPYIAQGGVTAHIRCDWGSCNPQPRYFGWSQFFGETGSSECSELNVNAGHTISVWITNNGLEGGDQHLYSVSVNNLTTQTGCGWFRVMAQGAPNFAQFVVERPLTSRGEVRLTAGLSRIYFERATVVYGSPPSYHSISDPYLSKKDYIMFNNGYENTYPASPVESDPYGGGLFYVQYKWSWGTPYPEPTPSTPTAPTGPTSLRQGQIGTYSTRATVSSGAPIRYQFDWNDGSTTTTGWFASGATASAAHSWGYPGTYHVKVRANTGVYWSAWSTSIAVYVAPTACPPRCLPSGSFSSPTMS